ncbi:oxysterol-binding protein 1 isoform X2 [Hyposmocoma kahamanoa]|uniref:oxysterol-binding protein 1 isoform X2 n=1 Tax=Hyposmocoma kahamanoa TaxID=1477025 RepID=UPI000E6D910B|nr:oxysterol-binding protein 1 isoform X2 [Hyposmocoma kahamanoa]
MSDAIVPKGQPISGDPEKKGWLFKWTNYLKGYQRRWFVLSNGLLSYYRNQAEMAHTCRGTISLLGALIHTADSCTFVISNGGTQTFHIRAHDEVERQSWVTALELAKAKAIRAQESDDDEDQIGSNAVAISGVGEADGEDAGGIARELAARFHDLRTCSELVARHGAVLQRSLVDLEIPPSDITIQVAERATLFRISCNAMMNACSEFMSAAAASTARMSRALQHEREQKMRLQEVVEQLARQHDNLEKTVTARSTPHSGGNGSGQGNETEDEDHEFFDAMEEGVSSNADDKTAFVMKVPVNRKSKVKSGESSDESEGETVTETQQVVFVKDKEGENMGGVSEEAASTVTKPKEDIKVWPHVSQVVSMVDGHTRRSRVPDKPNYPLSLWSIMKNCIGKELSKIPIPVNFSEPLSMLQRLTEDYEYSYILDEAAKFSDPAQQLAYVAAFTISAYATTSNRTNKPFNPLLGETYECDRMTDLGWRSISEQVIHYPPTCAVFTEGMSGWRHTQQWSISSRFRGQYVTISPDTSCHIVFTLTGNKYSYQKVTTTVHNIIVGKLWVDNHGDMDIKGEAGPAKGYVAHLKYLPYAYFSKDTQRKVTGVINDPKGVPRYVLQGYWDSRVEVAPVTSASADGTQCTTGKFVVAWERVPAPPDSDKWYNFTLLAAQLNEHESGVAPTDSRLRPDQRLMEEGLWNEANEEKLRLEEKQRTKRRELEAATEAAAAAGQPAPPSPRPLWFSRESVGSPGNPHLCHMYNHRYWECKKRQEWAGCPDIF